MAITTTLTPFIDTPTISDVLTFNTRAEDWVNVQLPQFAGEMDDIIIEFNTELGTINSNTTTSTNNKNDAQKLAIHPEDSQFTLSDGVTLGYSALHYSAKASDSATTATTKASEALGSANNASDSAIASATSATLSQNWATSLTIISGGLYGARYYAEQALIYRNQTVDVSLPSASANPNKYLKSDGTAWIASDGTSITVDATITELSTNPVESQAIFDALATKQATLVSGTNIKTINSTSILGSGNIVVSGATTLNGLTDVSTAGVEDGKLYGLLYNSGTTSYTLAEAESGFDPTDPTGDNAQIAYYSFDASSVVDEDAKSGGDTTYTPAPEDVVNITYTAPNGGANGIGKAAVFDGATSTINNTLTLPAQSSISFWAYRTSTDHSILFSSATHYMPFNEGTNTWLYSISDGAWAMLATTQVLPLANTWYHIVMTDDGSSIKGYRDGVNIPNTVSTYYSMSGFLMRMGYHPSQKFAGYIDQVHIFNRALTLTEIQDIYVAEGGAL